jgi:hypothetical protein
MRAVLRILLYVMALVLGAAMLAYYWDPGVFVHVERFRVDFPREARLVAAGLAMVLLLSPLSILLRFVQAARRSKEISYTTDTGRVSVNLIAIQEALTRALEHEDCVKKAHVHLYEDRVKRQVVIDAAMTFWEVPNVTERNRQCQILLRRRFAELLPEQRVVVNLSVHRITPKREKDAAREETGEKVDSSRDATRIEDLGGVDPFTGTPRKPVETPGELPLSAYLQTSATDASLNEQMAIPTEDDLYVGPSYPVGDDDDESSADNIVGHPYPARKQSQKRR